MGTDAEKPYVCLFCGESIARSHVDPCAGVLAAGWQEAGFEGSTGQYWFHAECLRTRTHKSVPLYFLEMGDIRRD